MTNSQNKFNHSNFFLPYQKRWLQDESMFKIWQKSRRIGATYIQAYEDVRDCVKKKYFYDGEPLSVWFSSADISAAKEYILYCKKWAKLFNEVLVDFGEIVVDENKDIKALCIEFKNGARINALSSNGTQFRSKGGKVILDEFAHHENQEDLWTAALPCTTWGFPIRVLSTHNGMGCFFYKLIEDIKKGVFDEESSMHQTSIQLAVDEGLADKIMRKQLTLEERDKWLEKQHKRCRNEFTWQQEYCCIPIDEATAFLTYELIASCESEDVLRPLSEIEGDMYVGMDPARTSDLSVIWVIEKLGDVKYTRIVKALKNLPFHQQREILYKILAHKKLRRFCIDSTGIGRQLAEEAQIKFGKSRVELVNFSNATKEKMAYDLLTSFQDKTQRIPADNNIREDLHSVKRVTTVAGNIRFDVDSSETDGHADRFWSLALANHAVGNKPLGQTKYASTGKRLWKKITQNY